MSDCTNPKMRERLFAYEFAMLDDTEREELELHLYQCDSCYNDMLQFAPWAEFLRDSPVVRDAVLAGSEQPERSSGRTILTRVIIAIAAVLVIALPTYYYLIGPSERTVTQTISLVPARALVGNVINLDLHGQVEIGFVGEGTDPSREYTVTITTTDGTTAYDSTSAFFATSEQGSIVVPVGLFEAGPYLLNVIDRSVSPADTVVTYVFRAE